MLKIIRVIMIINLLSIFQVSELKAQDTNNSPFEVPIEGLPEALILGLEFEAPSALAFDTMNRPYMFNSREPQSFGSILTIRNEKWVRLSFLDSLKKAYPNLQKPKSKFLHALGMIAIDDADAIYVIIQIEKSKRNKGYVLLYSPDLKGNFQVYDLPGKAVMEIRTGWNRSNNPPVIGSLRFRKEHPAKWTDYYNLSLFIPVKQDSQLILGDPIHITENCFGLSNHSGGTSFAATTDSNTYVVYAEISEEENGGNPTYIATIDRKKREVVATEFLTIAPPDNPDVHSTPVVTIDSTGYLHVIAGAHALPFQYIRSNFPKTISAGWSEPFVMEGRQTYATLICDSDNRLHCIYRIHPRLIYQNKPAISESWSEPFVLVNPPRGHKGYSIFYHRFFIDRKSALYLSYTFYEQRTGKEGRYPRTLVVSEDNGKNWRKVTTYSFLDRMTQTNKEEPALNRIKTIEIDY
jgi:hypothetical protein